MNKFIKHVKVCALVCLLSDATLVVAEEEYLTGIVKPLNDIELSFPVDGTLKAAHFKEGQSVQKGDVILQLDGDLQALEVTRKKLIWKDKSAAKMLRENVLVMDRMLIRKTHLYETQKSLSQAELDGYTMQKNKVSGDYQNLLEAEKREEIEFNIADEVLSYYELSSPISGVVVEIVPAVGEWVKVGEKAVRLVDASLCFVEFDVTASTASSLRRQPDVTLSIDHHDESLERAGKAEFVSIVADESSGLVQAKIYFDNGDGLVLPGVSATLILGEESNE